MTSDPLCLLGLLNVEGYELHRRQDSLAMVNAAANGPSHPFNQRLHRPFQLANQEFAICHGKEDNGCSAL